MRVRGVQRYRQEGNNIAAQHDPNYSVPPDGTGGRRDRNVHGGVRHRHYRRSRVRSDSLQRHHWRLHCRSADQHHQSRAEHQGLCHDGGFSTVEAALAIATLVVVLVLCCAGVTAISMQLRCIDAAREAARLAARGDPAATVAIAGLAPPGASTDLRRDGGYVIARVSSRSAVLPGILIVGEAVSALEPGQ